MTWSTRALLLFLRSSPNMASSPAHSSSVEDTVKAAPFEAIDEPNKLQCYTSAPGVIDEVTRVIDHKAERRLCRKFDFRLLPILAIMCKAI